MGRLAAAAVVVALVVATAPARAGAELELLNGQVLTGIDVERTREGLYLLTVSDEEVIPVPVDLVKKIRLTGGEEPAPTGFKIAVSENLVGPPEPTEPPRTRDQLAAFGRSPAAFRAGSVETRWRPRSALGPDVSQFSPVRWFKAPTDPNWVPRSAFKASADATQFNPVRWYRPALDPIWRPSDGWRPATRWFD